jgi:methyl-accepting chemotaxis protein
MPSTKARLQKKFLSILFIIGPLFFIALGIFYYYQARIEVISALSDNLMTIARTGSMQIDGLLFDQIRAAEDYNKSEFNQIHQTLVKIQSSNNLEPEHVFTLRREENITTLVASAQRRNIIGRESGLQLEMNPVFNNGQTTVKKPYQQNKSQYMSSFAPIFNRNTVVGILQIDLNIAGRLPGLLQYLLWPLVCSIIFATVVLIFIPGALRQMQKNIDALARHFNAIAEGDIAAEFLAPNRIYLLEITEILEKLQSGLQKHVENVENKEKMQKQIKSLLRIVSGAAEGDFTVTAHVSADTLGALSDSFNLMISDLSALIRDVKKGAEQVSDFTKVISQTTKNMAKGARNQAQEIVNINTLAKEMATIANNTNDSAQRAAEAAQFAKDIAQKGGDIVKGSIEAMHRIGETVLDTSKRVTYLGDLSDRIEDITEFISDISNRTNLLALNASIEAARAGSAGKGFSIVADEVRNLAQHSSSAAAEITNLIEDIQEGTSEAIMAMDLGNQEVEESTTLVDKAGAALREILGSVDTSANSAAEISNATQQQQKSNEEVVTIMEGIAQIAQETAEGAVKSEIEIARLETLSKSLDDAVAKFKLP